MEDDENVPIRPQQQTHSAGRGRGHSATGAPTRKTQPTSDSLGDGNYKLENIVRRDNINESNERAHHNETSQLRSNEVSQNQGIPQQLSQWSLPTHSNANRRGSNGGIHNGFFYSEGLQEGMDSDDDDVNNNALYYGDEQLRTGVTKKGSVAMSPGRIRRTPQSSTETTPTFANRGRGGGASGRGAVSAPMTESYQKSAVVAPSSARGSGTVGVLNNDHRVTTKGRQIREDVDNMMDAYYGNGGVNEYNNLGSMGGMVGGCATGLRGGHARGVPEDESTQQIDVRTSNVRGGVTNNRTALASCTAPAVADSAMSKPQTALARMNPSWQRGPKNEEGRTFDASDRNLLCMDVRGDSAVVGSADHGLKVFDINTMRERRNLYGKKCGHTEWVTSVAYLSDGRILSGGMDSKLCLWHASALKCDDLLGHTGSISQVEVSPNGIAVSSSYDRTLRVWNCASRSCLSSLVGHGQPVTNFAWAGTMVMSGDRRGTVKVWDLESSSCAATYETKGGQIGSLGHLLHPDMGQISMVGDQKGTVSIFDFRRNGATPIYSDTLHPGGVVSGLKGMPLSGGNGGLIVSCGADRKINVLDPRMNFKPIHVMADHKDFIYSMEVFGDLVISGGGNGWLLVHDTKSGKCLYGLGANAAAIRCIFASNEHLVAAGDDGKAMVYDF